MDGSKPKAHVHEQTSRTREKPSGDEEATAELKLGEFQNVPTLSLSEARLLINAVLDNRRKLRKVNETETLIKTQDYLEVFARFKQTENIEAVERVLGAKTELELFEKSQLGSLCCETAEEAKTLIPSLASKISDDDLQDLLNDITQFRNLADLKVKTDKTLKTTGLCPQVGAAWDKFLQTGDDGRDA